jgi:hypothetical protein
LGVARETLTFDCPCEPAFLRASLGLALQPGGNQVPTASPPLHHKTASGHSATLEVTATSLHDASDPPIAKGFIATEGALLHGTLQVALEALDQPVDLEIHTSGDDSVEMTGGVLEGEGVRIGEIRGDVQMEFGGQTHQVERLGPSEGIAGHVGIYDHVGEEERRKRR